MNSLKSKNLRWTIVFERGALATLCTALLLCGCMLGGAEIGNPRTVSGKVVDSDNHPLGGMTLTLVAAETFNPVYLRTGDTAGRPFKTVRPVAQTTTDQNGNYSLAFRGNSTGLTLYGQNGDTSIMVYHPALNLEGKETMTAIDTARASRTVVIGITDSLFAPARFVYIKGTTLATAIDSVGRTPIRSPQGTVDLCLYSAITDSLIPALGFGSVAVAGNVDRIDISSRTHAVSPPTVPQGNTQVVYLQQGSGTQYMADSARSNLNDPLEYRFDWGDGAISEWGTPQQSFYSTSKIWNSPGTYRVKAQARSIRDTSILSDYSDSLVVTVQ